MSRDLFITAGSPVVTWCVLVLVVLDISLDQKLQKH